MKNTGLFAKTSAALGVRFDVLCAALLCVFALAGCGENDAEGSNPQADGAHVSFVFAAQTGHTENSVEITLVFDGDIPDLSADDITVTWVNPALSAITVKDIVGAEETPRTDETKGYILTLGDVTTSGKITVSVSKTGHAFSPDSRTVNISNVAEPIIPISFVSAKQTGYKDGAVLLTLVFDGDILGLSKGDITVTSEDTGLITEKGVVVAAGVGVYTLTLGGVTTPGTITVSVRKTGYAFSPDSRTAEMFDVVNPSNASIKAKFGITETRIPGVKKTFEALHGFIEGGGLVSMSNVIQLGDWIDLEGGITVNDYAVDTSYAATGGFQYTGASDSTRLIVVGINSFNGRNGNNRQHVVFMFKNIPVERRMNPTDTNAGGYAASEMRKYLVPYSGSSGNFLTGLENAGVPQEVLWGPNRIIAREHNGTDTNVISDLLWLPTEWEIFGSSRGHPSSETASNQVWLNYSNNGAIYCLSSPWFDLPNSFCYAAGPKHGPVNWSYATTARGVIPAFCVQ
jgi:hypothetical protein